MTYHYPLAGPWVDAVKAEVGNDWFLFNALPEELRDRRLLTRAAKNGLLRKKRFDKKSGRRLWRVTK